MARQESFNAYVGRELKNNAFEIRRVADNIARVKDESNSSKHGLAILVGGTSTLSYL